MSKKHEKPTIELWAEREVEIAMKRIRERAPNGDCGYDAGCYESALKAYKCLCQDGHSGFSWGATIQILDRLCHTMPLTPIIDEDFDGVYGTEMYDRLKSPNGPRMKETSIQCLRMSSLFKSIWEDGTITYHDIDRTVCINSENYDDTFGWGFAERFVDELYPITLPYYPKPRSRYKVWTTQFSVNGMDVFSIDYIECPDGTRKEIPLKYFKDNPLTKTPVNITEEEYMELKSKRDVTIEAYYADCILRNIFDDYVEIKTANLKKKYGEELWNNGKYSLDRIFYAITGAVHRRHLAKLGNRNVDGLLNILDLTYEDIKTQCKIFDGHQKACWNTVHILTSPVLKDQEDFIAKWEDMKPVADAVNRAKVTILDILDMIEACFMEYADKFIKVPESERQKTLYDILHEIDPIRFKEPTEEEIKAKAIHDQCNCGDCCSC